MIILSEIQLHLIESAALLDYPNEMCGFLTEDSFIHCKNYAEEPEKAFKISAVDYAKYFTKATAVVHTHVPPKRIRTVIDPRTPGIEDLEGQKATGLPWLIFSCDGKALCPDFIKLPREYNNNYLDRPFMWFITDCYTLVQDYYFFELSIKLPDHKAKGPYTDIRMLNNLFDDWIEIYNFRKKLEEEEVKNGDLLLLDNGGFKRNHLGIYHDGKVYHQDMLSVFVPFSTFFGRINEVLRYVG